jgi:hypothetical protein
MSPSVMAVTAARLPLKMNMWLMIGVLMLNPSLIPASSGLNSMIILGDFWFQNLKEGKSNLEIKALGLIAKTFKDLDTKRDINPGDIPLF